MADKKPAPKAAPDKAPKVEHFFAFNKENYLLMAAGIIVLILGFWLMSGKEDIFSSTKLTVAPIVVMIGFIIELIAIMRKPRE